MPQQKSGPLVISGYYGHANFGDDVALAGLEQTLHTAGFATRVGVRGKDSDPNHFTKGSYRTRLREVRASNGVVVGPGGILKPTAKGTGWSIAAVALFDVLSATIFGKPTFGYSLGAAKNLSKLDRAMIKLSFGQATHVGVRDGETNQAATALGLPVSEATDSVFGLLEDQTPAAGGRVPGRRVGVSPSASDLRQIDDPDAFLDRLAASLIATGESYAAIIAHGGDHGDGAVIRALQDRGVSIDETIDISEMKLAAAQTALGALSAILSQRFHVGIAAAATGAPVIMFGQDAKLSRLADELGYPHLAPTDFGEALDIAAAAPAGERWRQSREIATAAAADLIAALRNPKQPTVVGRAKAACTLSLAIVAHFGHLTLTRSGRRISEARR